jgi:heat shock protein HtpX
MAATGMYALISANKRNSWLLVIVLCLVLAAIAGAGGVYFGGEDPLPSALVFGLFGLGIATIGGLVSYFMGAEMIMAISGAHPAGEDDQRQLHNILEELCIASGLPKPKLYIIKDSAPNAFACGRDPQHSAVAVTRGLMDKLSRNELQGVLAHELSHVENYDIRFATMISILVGSIALLCDMLLRSMRWGAIGGRRRSSSSRSSSGGGQAQALLLVLALVLMILAPLFAQILQLAASRQREYLADASGAKMTRDPESLARALEKIAGDPEPLEAANRGTQHLYIVNPLKGLSETQSWFATHPPLRERIARLRSMT